MSDHDLNLLRAWAPPGEPVPDEGAVASRARARLHAHIATSAGPGRRRARGRTVRRLILAAAPAALVAAVIVALVVALGASAPEHRFTTRPATAAQALEQAAAAAETAADTPLPTPRQFFYIRSVETVGSCVINRRAGYCVLANKRHEAWTSLLRDGRTDTRLLGHSWPSDAERRKWIAAGRPGIVGLHDETFALHHNGHYFLGNDALSYTKLRAFDLTGAALFRQLRDGWIKGQGGSRDDEIFTWIADALRSQPTTPKLRAALYRALEYVPGLTYRAAATDRLGRTAVAVGRTDRRRGVRDELLFDPHTSEVLGEREIVVAHVPRQGITAPIGTVIGEMAYEQRGVVDRLGQKP